MSIRPLQAVVLGFALAACQAGEDAVETVNVPDAPVLSASNTVEIAPKEEVAMSAEEKAAIAPLLWVKTADAKSDAAKALVDDTKPVVHAFAGRMRSHPGLSPEEFAQIESRVTSTFVPGMGDVLHGASHKAVRREVRDYASDYNRRIYEALTAG